MKDNGLLTEFAREFTKAELAWARWREQSELVAS